MHLGNRYSQHSFAQIPDVKIARSQMDRSYTVKDTFDFDYLVPFYVDEIVPGDTFNCQVSAFARLATQLVPIMDNMYIDFFFFFVPNRLVYDKWEKLNGAKDNPDDTTDYISPPLAAAPAETGFVVGTIYDKMGLPTGVPGVDVANTMPLRGYLKIWNDWFRDQNLQDSVEVPTGEGPDAIADFMLLKRNKKHDYFTSCLPFLQKGDPVLMPLGDTAPVISNNQAPSYKGAPGATGINDVTLGYYAAFGYASSPTPPRSNDGEVVVGAQSGLVADLEDAVGPSVNAFREAIMMQSLFELDARGGTRYVEILRSHFGVISPDFRLQRAEFLGSGSAKINSHPVAQTAITSGANALGQLAAFSTASAGPKNNIGFTKSFVEHGYVLGLMCARADITYQQGLNRMWSKSTRYDFFWPKLQQLGEQAVLNQEIFVEGDTTDLEVFGYQERYAEYKYKPSEIHGEFRSTYSTPLDQWHMAEEFGTLPMLNDEFIEQNTPIDRAIAVSGAPHLLIDLFIKLRCARPMMTYAVPATLGRF